MKRRDLEKLLKSKGYRQITDGHKKGERTWERKQFIQSF